MARDIPGCTGTGCTCGNFTHAKELAEQFGALADQLCRDGDFREASRMYERQIEQLETAHGKDSTELVPALLNASDACRTAERKGRSTELLTRSLALLEKNLGLTGDDPATVLELYARRLQSEGRVYLHAQMSLRVRTMRCRRDA